MIIFQGLFPLTDDSGSDLVVTSVTASPGNVVVVFSHAITLTGASIVFSNWVISGGVSPPAVLNVSLVGNVVTITTPEDILGQTRTLTVPNGIVKFSDGAQTLQAPFSFNFPSSGVTPIVTGIVNRDAKTIEVIFSEPVVESEALNIANYSISPSLAIRSASKVQDNRYRLDLLQFQTPAVEYTLTATNIHDLAGNVI